MGTDKLPKDIATVVRNNGGGHWNHSFFWKVMTSPSNSGGPSREVKVRTRRGTRGDIDYFKWRKERGRIGGGLVAAVLH